jgi:hypothetical protein
MMPKSTRHKYSLLNTRKARTNTKVSSAGDSGVRTVAALSFVLCCAALSGGCRDVVQIRDVRPLVMHDVPAQRLAFRFKADTGLPKEIRTEESNDKAEAIQMDFNTNRKNDALVRTVASPDGRRVLALYGTADEPNEAFRIDLYSDDGKFLRNLTPPDLAGTFPDTVAWSPDGNHITFIAHRSLKATQSPTPLAEPVDIGPLPAASGSPTPVAAPSAAPAFAPVKLFATEQIYIANRDGYDLKPLTSREGLIYFYFSWAPDNHALVALACKENEWSAREKEYKQPAGRPRLLELDGKERLLDDQLTEALPVWSPDAAKVATAFDTEVGIFDAATSKPTQARIPLREALLAASVILEQKTAAELPNDNARQQTKESAPSDTLLHIPSSFNPIVRLEWPTVDKLYIKTAYVRLYSQDVINNFQRWHLVLLSPQAAILK